MGRKKRLYAKTSIPPTPASPSAATDDPTEMTREPPTPASPSAATDDTTEMTREPPTPASPPATIDPNTESAKIFDLDRKLHRECLEVLNTLEGGNHAKALRFFRDVVSHNSNNALLHYWLGSVHLAMAGKLGDDSSAKSEHLWDAAQSLQRAVELFPMAFDIARVYIGTISYLAKDEKDCQKEVQECKRALSIESPALPTFIAEKIPLLPDHSTESVEEPIRQGLYETKAASMGSNPGNDQNVEQKLSEEKNKWVDSGSDQNVAEKIKNVESVKNLGADIVEVQGTLSEEREKLVTDANVQEKGNELEEKLNSAKSLERKNLGVDVVGVQRMRSEETDKLVRDANKQAKGKGIEEKLNAAKLLLQNLQLPALSMDIHHMDVPSDLASTEFFKQLRKRIQPIDYWNNSMSTEEKRELFRVRLQKLAAYLENCPNPWPGGGFFEAIGFAIENKTWKFWESCSCAETLKFADFELYVEHVKRHVVCLPPELQSILPQEIDKKWVKEVEKGVWKPVDAHAALSCTELPLLNIAEEGLNDWPPSDDTEQMEILQKIRDQLQKLITSKCLAESHITKVKLDTMEMLQASFTEEQLKNHGLDRTLFCICFLKASQLEGVLKFLEELVGACNSPLQCFPEDTFSNELHCFPAFGNRKAITFSKDFSYFLLDKQILREEMSSIVDDDNVVSSVVDDGEEDALLDDTLVRSLYVSPMLDNCLATWESLRVLKNDIVRLFCESLSQEFERSCMTKCFMKHLLSDRMKAVKEVEHLFLEEITNRDQVEEHVPQSFVMLLLGKCNELAEKNQVDGLAKVVTAVLDEACADIQKVPAELLLDYLANAEARIQPAFLFQKKKISKEVCIFESMILGKLASVDQTLLKLEGLSGFDYHLVMLPLVKSFIREELEAQADKDANKRAEAAAESLLTEVDDEKTVNNGGHNVKKTQKEAQDKSEGKKLRNTEDSKACDGSEEHLAPQKKTTEQVCSQDSEKGVLKRLEEYEHLLKHHLDHTQIGESVPVSHSKPSEDKEESQQDPLIGEIGNETFADSVADSAPVSQSKPKEDEEKSQDDPLLSGETGNLEGSLNVSANSQEGTVQ